MGLAVLHLLLNAAGAAGGALAARRSLKLGALLGGFALFLVLAKFAAAAIPAAEANVFPWPFYPFVERWWFFPLVFFLVGVGVYASRKSMWRRDLLLVFTGLLLIRVGDVVWAEASPPPKLAGVLDEEGYCPQTTNYTCGAASAAMFLHLYGIESTEDEMARLCVTRSGLGGTSESGMVRGLENMGLDVRVTAPDEVTGPCVASVWITPLIAHFVVVREVTEDGFVIYDPAGGIYTMTHQRWKKFWMGSIVEVADGREPTSCPSYPSSLPSSR